VRISERWMAKALCAGMPVSMFYAERGSRKALANNEKRAKRLCAACPVRLECLSYALQIESKQLIIGGARGSSKEITIKPQAAGIWGGHTAKERTLVNIRHYPECNRRGHGACRPLDEQVSLLEELFVMRVHKDRILLGNEEVA
jgi:WhiB family redox-sensing transcriptional regulator